MKFSYNPVKAAQAAAYLVQLNRGQMDVYALIKILYLSDRKALTLRGLPITGDAMVSMPYGPVLSQVYDESKSPTEIQDPSWREYFTGRENNMISLLITPKTDELSEFERSILAETYEQYSRYGFKDLETITSKLPEYRNPHGSSLPIDPTKILQEEGWTREEIEDARMSAQEEFFFKEICK